MWLLKHYYLYDTWNLIDASKVIFTNIYLIMALAGTEYEENLDMRFVL
jgi:hypothetical protein